MNIPNGTSSRSDIYRLNGGIDYMVDDGDSHPLGSMLPNDEEELLAGLMDDLNFSALPVTSDDLEDYDLFGSGGGFELETDPHDNLNKGFPRSIASEHPSRTLFARNIHCNIDDSELQVLFEQYGDIRTLHTACKHRGFVMVSYYDIRASKAAMRALQNKLLKRRKLDIHFSIPKYNPSEKDVNQGTLVVFNLASSVSNKDLENIFGAYGEIKEIRETPNKRHHKFVEFFDVRSADAALKALNRTDIAGKRIKLEHSRPGGVRRNMMLQMNQELDQDDSSSSLNHVESPLARSPAGNYWCNSTIDHIPQSFRTNLSMAASVDNDQGRRISHLDHLFLSRSHKASSFQQSQSFGSVSSFGSLNSNHSHVETLSGSEFLWGSPSSSAWPANQFSLNGNLHRYPYSAQNGSLHQHHHVRFAPYGFFLNPPETSSMCSVSFRGTSGNMNTPRNMDETGSPSFKMLSSPRHSQLFTDNGSYQQPVATIPSIDGTFGG